MINRRPLFWIVLFVLFLVFLYLIRSILLPFVLGIGTAYFLDPAADRLEARGFSRNMATLIITAVFFSSIFLLSLVIVPLLVQQFSGLIAALPGYISDFDQKYSPELSRWLGGLPMMHMHDIQAAMADFSGVMLKFAESFLAGVFQSGMLVVTVFSLILITPIVAFYLLRDWDRMVERLNRLLPRPHAETIREQLRIIDRTLAGFVRGQLTVCLTLGTYYALALTLAGLKFGAIIGLITGFLVIFPYVGFMVGFVTGMTAAFFQFESYGDVGVILAIFIVGQICEGYILTPRLIGQRVGLHPVWIIFGMLSGGALFGFVGILIAVPVTAVIGVLSRFALEHYLHSDYYQGEAPPPLQ